MSNLKLKEIESIISKGPVVTVTQLKLSRWIANHYFVSQAEALKLFLPQPLSSLDKASQSINKGIKQDLLLFPTLRQAETARNKFPGVVFTRNQTAQEFANNWRDIASGKVRRILGTRSALFAPFANLQNITIFQPESDLYQEERRPYYRALAVAQQLSHLSGAKLEAISFSPRIADQFSLPHTIRQVTPGNCEIVNLRHEKVINDHLLDLIAKFEGKRVLIFLNRKSEKGALICRTCKTNSYVSDPSVCPNCGSSDVKFQVFNLPTLSRKITTLTKASLTFSTQQIFFQEVIPFDLVVALSADTYLSQNSYLSSEKTFQMLTQLSRLLSPKGLMIVQTAYPDLPCIKLALTDDYLGFYQTELQLRQETGYPPFAQLAVVTYAKPGIAPTPDLPEGLAVFGPFSGKRFDHWVVRGKALSPLAILTRPWKIELDPINL